MRKRRSLPPLPPLSRQALGEVEVIEEDVQDLLANCGDNREKALRILRTGIVDSLNVQTDYYFSLPIFHPVWLLELIKRAVDSLIGLCPVFTSGEQFRSELQITAINRLNARGVKPAKQSIQSEQQPEVVPIGKQLELLREECGITVEDLAEAIDVRARSVYRHLSGEAVPRRRNLAAYEKLFSKRLERLIRLTASAKRQ